MFTAGQKAPDFSAVDQYGSKRSLSDFNKGWVLLYFYPKDDTPGCTAQACGLRDSLSRLQSLNVSIVGVSADDETSHRKFSDKYALSFPILADTDKHIVNTYGVWGEKSMYGKTYMGILRTSFLIDPEGIIQKVYERVKPDEHADEVLADVKEIVKG